MYDDFAINEGPCNCITCKMEYKIERSDSSDSETESSRKRLRGYADFPDEIFFSIFLAICRYRHLVVFEVFKSSINPRVTPPNQKRLTEKKYMFQYEHKSKSVTENFLSPICMNIVKLFIDIGGMRKHTLLQLHHHLQRNGITAVIRITYCC